MTNRSLMTYAVAFVVAFVAHVSVLQGLGDAARRARKQRQFSPVVELAVRRLERPVRPPPEPEPPPPKPAPVAKPKVASPIDLIQTKLIQTKPVVEPQPPPPNTDQAAAPAATARPVFGISMSSVVDPGGNPAFSVRIGNTLLKDPEPEFTSPEQVRPYAPVALAKVTRMPVPRGPCQIPYPARADELGIEGAVKLDVVVLADGSVGEVRLVEGVGYGLDEAAITGIKKCRFEPAQIGDDKVPTRIPYTYRFYIDE